MDASKGAFGVLAGVIFANCLGPTSSGQSIELVSVADDGTPGKGVACGAPSVSDDGSRVAFWSASNNLVANDNNSLRDVFVRDRTLRTTVLVSRSSSGTPSDADCANPRISADGRFVVFTTPSGLSRRGRHQP